MKELEGNLKTKTELSIKKQQQIEREFIGRIIPYPNHKIWEINKETLEIKEAMFIDKPFIFGQKSIHNLEVLYREGYAYVGALNKKTAMKHFHNGKNGSKPVTSDPLKLNHF